MSNILLLNFKTYNLMILIMFKLLTLISFTSLQFFAINYISFSEVIKETTEVKIDQKLTKKLNDMSFIERWKNIFNKDKQYNPAFHGKDHSLEIGLGISYENYRYDWNKRDIDGTNGKVYSNSGIYNVYGKYSIPVHLFFHGRTSIEIGGILGQFPSGNINQVYGGLLHEFIFDLKYCYFTIGGGFSYRSIRGGTNYQTDGSDYNNLDGINSRLVAQIRIGFGINLTENTNLEIFFKHFSNGHLQNPNFGYNFIGMSVAFLL